MSAKQIRKLLVKETIDIAKLRSKTTIRNQACCSRVGELVGLSEASSSRADPAYSCDRERLCAGTAGE